MPPNAQIRPPQPEFPDLGISAHPQARPGLTTDKIASINTMAKELASTGQSKSPPEILNDPMGHNVDELDAPQQSNTPKLELAEKGIRGPNTVLGQSDPYRELIDTSNINARTVEHVPTARSTRSRSRSRSASTSSSSEDSRPRYRQRTWKRDKIANRQREANDAFVRDGGIVYVSDEKWAHLTEFAVNCHLYVSPLKTATGKQSNTTSGDEIKPTSHHGLPRRLRFVNELLNLEIGKWLYERCGLEDLNQDHVAPFRVIVSFEGHLRELHRKKEDELADRLRNTTDQTTERDISVDYVPTKLAYGVRARHSEKYVVDVVSRLKILVNGLRELIRFMDNDLNDIILASRKASLDKIERLPFSYLWYLFQPGQEIVSKSERRIYRVLNVTGGRYALQHRRRRSRFDALSDSYGISGLSIDCFYFDYDGKRFRPLPKTIIIRPYSDLMDVTSLKVYPLSYDQTGLSKSLFERGQKFAHLSAIRHKRYKGLSLVEGELFDRHEEIDSDVVVDFELAYRNSDPKIPIPEFGGGVIWEPTQEDEAENSCTEKRYDNTSFFTEKHLKTVHSGGLLEPCGLGDLRDDILRLLPDRVYGYVLLRRKWYPLDIDLVSDIPPLKTGVGDGFERLVLPKGHKQVVRALVKTHARGQTRNNGRSTGTSMTRREFDVVEGKGKGLIILLHGSPGVGKTSTAECVAAHTGRPLFPITCGDIGGNTAQEVEKSLEGFSDLARKWGCVLLLDEADVFLSSRGGDIRQNSLVSVFLRVLEYYSGILILTTNRVGSFDEAVKSRVHCALYYPPLNEDDTLEIWEMSIQMVKDQGNHEKGVTAVEVDGKKILKFARKLWRSGHRWNGRQIKNAFQTAVALAEWENLEGGDENDDGTKTKVALELKHFEVVAQTSTKFDRYLEKVRRHDIDRAKTLELRRDDLTHDFGSAEIQTSGGKTRSKRRSKSKSESKPKSSRKRHTQVSSSSESESQDLEESTSERSALELDSPSASESEDSQGRDAGKSSRRKRKETGKDKDRVKWV